MSVYTYIYIYHIARGRFSLILLIAIEAIQAACSDTDGPAQVAARPFFEVNEAGIIEASSLRLAGSSFFFFFI